jgi:excisionase family DNA binding protein
MSAPEPLLDVGELAAWLRISPRTAYSLAERGQLPSLKVSNRLRFDRAAIEAWLAEQEGKRNGTV